MKDYIKSYNTRLNEMIADAIKNIEENYTEDLISLDGDKEYVVIMEYEYGLATENGFETDKCILDSFYKENDTLMVKGFWSDGTDSILPITELDAKGIFNLADWLLFGICSE